MIDFYNRRDPLQLTNQKAGTKHGVVKSWSEWKQQRLAMAMPTYHLFMAGGADKEVSPFRLHFLGG